MDRKEKEKIMNLSTVMIKKKKKNTRNEVKT